MNTTDLKYEIQKAIDNVPESALVDLLDYLKQIQITTNEKINLSTHLAFSRMRK